MEEELEVNYDVEKLHKFADDVEVDVEYLDGSDWPDISDINIDITNGQLTVTFDYDFEISDIIWSGEE